MAKQKPSGWLDKYASTVAASDATRVNKQLVPLNAKKVTQEELDAREVKARRDRIAVANAAKSKQLDSPEAFAQATSATADKLRLSEKPNVFDDYINPATYAGHLASGLGQVPLNIQEGNYGEAALNTLSPVMAGAAETLLSPVISKGIKSGRKAVDENFTKVGSALARIEKAGIAKGLSPHEIKMQQMNWVGITSAQREAYVPGVSDLLYKYTRPVGYTGGGGESKLSEIISNIRKGGVKYSKHSSYEDYVAHQDPRVNTVLPPREDAWRLYLGKPQKHGTFEMAQTAPIQHPAYTPEQLSGLDIYSIKSDFGKTGLFPGYTPEGGEYNYINYDNFDTAKRYLDNPIVVDKQNIIMGGHNKRLSKAGLEYNDVWDLNPGIAPINFLPDKLKSKFYNSPLFTSRDAAGTVSLREVQIPVDKFIGKPFMAHGVEQNVTSDKLVENMTQSVLNELNFIRPEKTAEKLARLKSLGINSGEVVNDVNTSHKVQMERAAKNLEEIQNYPKFKDGGWLEKYNDGGPVQPNYNEYSVSAPEGFEGDGYSNVGRNYSPAWGGQFKDGGELPNVTVKGKRQPIVVTNPRDPRLRAYNDSLAAYNASKNLPEAFTNSSKKIANAKTSEELIQILKERSNLVTPLKPFFEKGLLPSEKGNSLDGDQSEYMIAPSAAYKRGKFVPGALHPSTTLFFKKPKQPVIYEKPKPIPTPQSTIDWMEGNYAQEPIIETPQPQASAYGEVVDPRTGYTHMTRQGSPMYPMVGQNVPEMEEGGPVKRFMQPTETFKNYGYNPKENEMSTEYSTSIGGPGEVYLVPGYRQGRVLQDPEGVFNAYGEHLGGPFKTVQAAEDFAKLRHQYVEKNQNIPAPFKTRDYAMGGALPGATGSMYARYSGGGSMPGDVDFRYPRTGSIPDNGKYAKKTMASAQNGTEMEYYQNGLDWKPKNISKNGKKVIKDDRGQWDHPGEITEIGSNQITMQGVPYPVMGVSDTGDMQMMYPNQEYQYDGNSVTEYPMMQDGGELTKLDQLTNFTNYNTEQPGGWLEKYQDGGTVGNKWFPKEDLPVDVDVNAQAKTVTKKPAKQAIAPQPAVKSKGLSFEDIPTADDKKVIIDNFSKKYDYIVEGNKTYYRVKGGNTWDDVSDNKTAQKNLLQFIDKNDYWKGYNSGERELLYPNTTSKTAAPKPGVTPTTDETSFFDDLTTNAKGLINNTIVKPLVSSKNIVGKKAKDLQKGTSELVDDVVNSVKSGTNSAIKSTEDLSQTIMNGVTRKIKIFTGIGEDDVEILTEADSKKPKSIKEWYGKGSGTSTVLDTKDQDGRQYKQQVLPISSIKFGVRNREELKDINTEGMEITAFEPFSSNKKLPDNKTVLAIDSGGKLHTGTYKDFKNKPGFKVSETFVNKVMDLPDGKYKSAGPDNPGYQHPMAKVLDDNGKVVDGSINVLVKNDSKKNFYGSIQGGRVLFVDPTTKEQYLVSGSTQHIRDTFKKIKGNNKYLEAYTLDNGTYARGLSYKDGKLTKERLNAYDNENKSGGNGLYIIDNPKPANRYQEDYVENMPNIRTDKDESFKKGHPIKNEIKNIILHHTAYTDPKLNEKQVKDQYMSPGHSSSHVVIEEDGKRTIYASPEQVTFHAGESKWNNRDNVNDFGVGVEFQGDTNRKPLTNAQIESFIEYYKPIANKYGLTAKDIITHQMIAPGRKPDITNKEYNRILKYMKSKNFK